jgi:hypothetical protein
MSAKRSTDELRVGSAFRSVSPVPVSPMPVSSMKARFCLKSVALIGAIACVLVLVIATPGDVAGRTSEVLASGQSGPSSPIPLETYEGIITDTHCSAKHSAVIGKTAADCTILCVRAGEQFALVDGDTTYILDGDLVALKRVAGQRVKITGALSGGKISVTAIR